MKKPGQVRKEIYDYITSISGKDISDKEHKIIKSLLREHGDAERENEIKVQKLKIEALTNKVIKMTGAKRSISRKERPSSIRVWTPKK